MDAYMTVKTGKKCGLRLVGSSGPVNSVQLLARPSRGKASYVYPLILYTPAAGYAGQDTFTYAWKGETATGAPSTKTVTVHITVTP